MSAAMYSNALPSAALSARSNEEKTFASGNKSLWKGEAVPFPVDAISELKSSVALSLTRSTAVSTAPLICCLTGPKGTAICLYTPFLVADIAPTIQSCNGQQRLADRL